MNILMVTNTFTPHVGGVAHSVQAFSDRYRDLGHSVMVVCPQFDDTVSTNMVVRVPAIKHFRQTDFSFPLPIPSGAHRMIDEFEPDVVHSHHPFLLGDTALRVGAERGIPVVFTHHTQYDKYAHYIDSTESAAAKRFINDLDVGYCNQCDAVVAPSQTVADDLVEREVTTHLEVIPTGVDVDWWAEDPSWATREEYGIPKNAFVVGHVGRLAKEKNIPFLADSIATFLAETPNAWFVVAGVGPCEADILSVCEKHQVVDRLLTFGILSPVDLKNIYRAFDVFAFASKSETQGIVLAEAMAAGVPVVALEAPGVREIVSDFINGRLVDVEDVSTFAKAISWVADLDEANKAAMKRELSATASQYSIDRSVQLMLELYDWAIKLKRVAQPGDLHAWRSSVNRIESELKIWGNFAHAIGDAVVTRIRGNTVES